MASLAARFMSSRSWTSQPDFALVRYLHDHGAIFTRGADGYFLCDLKPIEELKNPKHAEHLATVRCMGPPTSVPPERERHCPYNPFHNCGAELQPCVARSPEGQRATKANHR
jgi:hypothetical protein